MTFRDFIIESPIQTSFASIDLLENEQYNTAESAKHLLRIYDTKAQSKKSTS